MTWFDDVARFCKLYNIPLEYLADTLNEPKVIPMVRGKAFEFTVLITLQDILPEEEFTVSKTPMNAQSGSHDIDVLVYHKPTDISLHIECKLASKGSYRYFKKSKMHRIRVKCMRSRTLGDSKVKQLAPEIGVSEELLSVHNDQYLPDDFDAVITSIGNAFYETDTNGLYIWQPDNNGTNVPDEHKGQSRYTPAKFFVSGVLNL